jgi:hypothetical protein
MAKNTGNMAHHEPCNYEKVALFNVWENWWSIQGKRWLQNVVGTRNDW